MMVFTRYLAVFCMLMHSVTQSEGNTKEKVFDTYFNGFCYWSEDVSYHVNYASGCKVYFTCQRGQFLDFYRCPESTIFDANTLQCDTIGICKDVRSVNLAYAAWWKNVAAKIDEVLQALDNSSRQHQSPKAQSSTTEAAKESGATVTITPSSTLPLETVVQTTDPLMKGSVTRQHQSPKAQSRTTESAKESGATVTITPSSTLPLETKYRVVQTTDPLMKGSVTKNTNLVNVSNKSSVSLESVTDSSFDNFESFDSFDWDSLDQSNISVAHTKVTSSNDELQTTKSTVNFIPFQFNTQTSFSSGIFDSYVTPKASLHEDLLNIVEGVNADAPSYGSVAETRFMNDFVYPLIKDIASNETIMNEMELHLRYIFVFADSLLYRILDMSIDRKTAEATTYTLKELKTAFKNTMNAVSLSRRILVGYLFPVVFGRIAKSGDIILNYLAIIDYKILDSMPSIFGRIFDIIFKYQLFQDTPIADQDKAFSLYEVRNDIYHVFRVVEKAFNL